MSTHTNDVESAIVVVGAGPVGMSAALALDARGLPVTVMEADPEDRERPGSRAIYVHGSTLRTWERNHSGLGTRLAEAGLVWPTRRTRWRGQDVFSRTYPDAGGAGDLPHFTSLPQVRTEAFLEEALEEADVDVVWDAAVTDVETSPDGVHLETADGRTREAPYVVGADGAESAVREEIGAEFEGSRSEDAFVIIDVDSIPDEDRPVERVFHYEHPEVGGRNVLIVPFSGGWRVDVQCPDEADAERVASDEGTRQTIETVLGQEYTDRVSWVSTYQFLQVIADRFVDEHRRVLLAGEAAHLFAPFGARGMNSGVADADEAASAIAVASRASVEDVARTEIEAFAARRERAAEWNRDAAGQALAALQDRPTNHVKRRLAAALSGWWEPAGEWMDEAPYGPAGGPPIVGGGKY